MSPSNIHQLSVTLDTDQLIDGFINWQGRFVFQNDIAIKLKKRISTSSAKLTL